MTQQLDGPRHYSQSHARGMDDWQHRSAYPVTFSSASALPRIYSGGGVLMGYAALETSGAASATFELYDGSDATAQLILPVSLSPGQSSRDWFATEGIWLKEGVFLNVLAGAVRGTVWIVMRTPA